MVCTIRGIHPKFTDPISGRTGESDQWESHRRIGAPEYTGFGFDTRWELIPGKWAIQVLYGGRIIAEKTFDVEVAQ